ncbi:MAG: calcium-translocating P-type ATPase, PMCA-type [Chloroflexota bacterium]
MSVTETRDKTTRFVGLSAAQVEASRAQHGENVLTPPPSEPWWKLYLEKFEDPVIRILIIAAVITMIVGAVDGHYAEGIAVIIAILLATTLAFVNEYRAQREFDVLNQVSDDAPTNVIRDGAFVVVPRKELVVGDMVLTEAGDEIPADGQVREAVSLQVNESLLTGESLPVRKTLRESDPEHSFPENQLYRSTMVVDGHGTFEISAVGNATKIGEIAREAIGETDEITPLNAQLERLSKLIGVLGFGVAGLTYTALVLHAAAIGELVLSGAHWLFFGILVVSVLTMMSRIWMPIVSDAFKLAGRELRLPAWLGRTDGRGWLMSIGTGLGFFVVAVLVSSALGLISGTTSEWLPGETGTALLRFFMIAVTIIVVAVPEGLPMSVTLSLAYSMRKMTATNNLVRRMHATETVGAATVICSDKTGTLTLNQMRVRDAHFPALGHRLLTRELETDSERLVAETLSANSTANLSRLPGEPVKTLGDSTEGALLLWLHERGIDYVMHRENFGVDIQLTFSSERKYMGTLGRSEVLKSPVVYIKGAPEIVLAQAGRIQTENGVETLDDERRVEIEDHLRGYQRRGMRTLAFSYKTVDDENTLTVEELAEDMIWLGYVAIADPIRPEVPTAIQACRAAGIAVKIVTGDNSETAKEIARQIGLWELEDDETPNAHMTGQEFSQLEGEALRAAVKNLKVLARARPMDKTRLVTTLQSVGEVVAVTGDGTNDAPALNYANVGLAMGSGTDIAKEASDIVLLDDSFRSIVNAVMWGRSLYQNIQRFILFQLTINVAALGIALLGPFIGVEFPLTVIQMLWVNLIMDTFASLALATEPARWDVMRRKPRKSTDFIISREMAQRIAGFGATFIVLLVGFLLVIAGDGIVTEHELSLFYATFILLQFWNLFNARVLGLDISAFKGLSENRAFPAIAAAILIGTILIIQFGGDIFRTVPLSVLEWLAIITLTSPVVLIREFLRYSRNLRAKNQQEAASMTNMSVG